MNKSLSLLLPLLLTVASCKNNLNVEHGGDQNVVYKDVPSAERGGTPNVEREGDSNFILNPAGVSSACSLDHYLLFLTYTLKISYHRESGSAIDPALVELLTSLDVKIAEKFNELVAGKTRHEIEEIDPNGTPTLDISDIVEEFNASAIELGLSVEVIENIKISSAFSSDKPMVNCELFKVEGLRITQTGGPYSGDGSSYEITPAGSYESYGPGA